MALNAGLVGTRVVVRRTVAGERGPSGGPALTDVLGILVAWAPNRLSVQRADGSVVVIAQADIVAAKPVPPRASVVGRVSAADLERVCAAGWRAPAEEPLGQWLLRAGSGFTGRANSVLAVGDPGLPLADALAAVERFYAPRGLTPLAQVISGSDEAAAFERSGWVPARPGQDDPVVQIASVARALRDGPRPSEAVEVAHDDQPTDDWVRCYGRTVGLDNNDVRDILASGDVLAFARVGTPARAIGRAVVTGDWVGLSAVEVEPSERRRGVGTAIVAYLLDWAASQGARSAYLQTMPDNVAGVALYGRFGFVTHHSYRYLRPPE